MRRRDLLALIGGATTLRPLVARAQQKPMPVVGFLSALSATALAGGVAAFHEGLSESGYVAGKNVAFEYRWAGGDVARLPALAADLITQKVEVIVAAAGTAPALAAKRATSTIPIVFTSLTDPISSGLVASLARPGGNVTGYVFSPADLDPKRLELMSELVPKAELITLLLNPNEQYGERYTRAMQDAAHLKGVQLAILKAGSESEINAAFASLVELRAGALVVASNPFFTERRDQLVALAAQHAVPATYHLRGFVAAGGLISYGSRSQDLYRGAGRYVGRILAGAKPADLPVQQATTFELVINLKTARALGLTVPQSLLSRADEVIE